MTRRAKQARSKGNARRTRRKVATIAQRDPLDDFIAASARALDLKIDKAWLPAVRANLAVTLKLGAMVAEFSLPDDAEPAQVFEA
jgi:hypothetical protein